MTAEGCGLCDGKTHLLMKLMPDLNLLPSTSNTESSISMMRLENTIFQLYGEDFGNCNCLKDRCIGASIEDRMSTFSRSDQNQCSIQFCNTCNGNLDCKHKHRLSDSQTNELGLNSLINSHFAHEIEENFHHQSISKDLVCHNVSNARATVFSCSEKEYKVDASEDKIEAKDALSPGRVCTEESENNYNEGYPKRIRRSKYYDIKGDLSHIRRDPKRLKRNNSDRKDAGYIESKFTKRVKYREMSTTLSSEIAEPFQKNSEEFIAETEDNLIVKELLKYILYPKSKEYQTFALTILKSDETLMRIFLEEKKKLGIQFIPVFSKPS